MALFSRRKKSDSQPDVEPEAPVDTAADEAQPEAPAAPVTSRMQYSSAEDTAQGAAAMRAAAATMTAEELGLAEAPEAYASEPETMQPVRVEQTPGRNEPCYCGSGKKYKLCHGR